MTAGQTCFSRCEPTPSDTAAGLYGGRAAHFCRRRLRTFKNGTWDWAAIRCQVCGSWSASTTKHLIFSLSLCLPSHSPDRHSRQLSSLHQTSDNAQTSKPKRIRAVVLSGFNNVERQSLPHREKLAGGLERQPKVST